MCVCVCRWRGGGEMKRREMRLLYPEEEISQLIGEFITLSQRYLQPRITTDTAPLTLTDLTRAKLVGGFVPSQCTRHSYS